jgi:hypothetical protein
MRSLSDPVMPYRREAVLLAIVRDDAADSFDGVRLLNDFNSEVLNFIAQAARLQTVCRQ